MPATPDHDVTDWPADPGERLSRLTHDLRTPLTVVEGFADLLDRRYEALEEDDRREYLGRIADGARELRAILDAERAARP